MGGLGCGRLAYILLLFLIAGACSSTSTDGSGSLANSKRESPGEADDSSADSPQRDEGSDLDGPTVPGGARDGSSADAGETGPQTEDPGQEAASRPATGALGRGVTDTEITVGFTLEKNNDVSGVGAVGQPPQERDILEALIEWTNDGGGLAGRKIVPVFSERERERPDAANAQAACARFTEDNEVFIVHEGPVGGSDALLSCLGPRKVPMIAQNLWLFDDAYYEKYAGYLYQPGKMRPDRWGAAYVDTLAREGFFENAKVGLARFGAPVFDRVSDGVVKPRLADLGIDPVEAVVSSPGGLSDYGAMNSEIGNVILRFRREGVTHVLFIENAGIMPFFFMQQAESQGWRPRYGLTSSDIPATMAGNQSPRQLANSIGAGWSPSVDVFAPERPGGNPAWETCERIMADHGIPKTYATYTFYTDALCDTFFFLKATLGRADELTAAGFRSATERLGDSYVSPFTFSTSFAPGKYDGAAAVRPFAYDTGCECFGYTGGPRAVP